jgi:site-specific DNA-methyltransferase (adenine-specific)
MIEQTDCLLGLQSLDESSVDCIITSPPYNKQGLIGKKQIGNQIWNKFNIDYSTYDDNMPEELYHQWMTDVLNECHRVIKPNGSIFFNHKPRRHKNRSYLPTDFISQSEANLYQLIIWNRKTSPNIRKDVLVPSTEHIYWMCKDKPKVFRDRLSREYISEVWTITPDRQTTHPAPFTDQVVRNCVLLSTEEGDVVLDPFAGIGTTLTIAQEMNRIGIGFEIDRNYINVYSQSINYESN